MKSEKNITRKIQGVLILLFVLNVSFGFSQSPSATQVQVNHNVDSLFINGKGDPMPTPPNPGGGSGQQIGGDGQLPEPPGPGGNGGGNMIGGDTTGIPTPPDPGGNGGGNMIGGDTTGIPTPPDPGNGYPLGTQFQQVTIPAGWSGISSYLIPYQSQFDSIFETQLLANQLVIVTHFGQMFYPATNINTLGSWNPNQGYAIKLSQPVTMQFAGLENSDIVVELQTGWNYLPVLSKVNIETSCLLDNLIENNQLMILSEIAGNQLFWPAFSISTLDTLKPGKSYLVKVSEPCSITFAGCANKNIISDDPKAISTE